MSSHSKVLWAVCPFLFKDNIYARPRPPFKASRIFQTKADATNWLEEPAIDDHREDGTPIYGTGTNARTWVGPVPVKGGVNLDHFGGAKVDQLVKG